MFLVCPKCLAATPEVPRGVGFSCVACGHAWEASHPALAKAYYAELGELELSLVADDGTRFQIAAMPAVIGRDSDFAALASNLAVSRRHCSLDFDLGRNTFVVQDLGAKGGTTIGGRPLEANQRAEIRPGEDLRISGVRLRLAVRLRTAILDQVRSPTSAGERSIDLTRCSPLRILGVESDGSIALVSGSRGRSRPLAAITRSADSTRYHMLVLRREAVRVNGEIIVERELMAADQIVLAGRCFRFNQTAGTLEPESPGGGPSISVRGLRVSYSSRYALADIRCTFPGGRLTAIVGESGCGKTTLLNVLCGLRTPDEGQVSVSDSTAPVRNYSGWAREHAALVPQHDVVHGELTIRKCLEYAAHLRFGPAVGAVIKRDRLDKAVRDAELIGLEDRAISQLSGGQRKRVNVAVELIGPTDVLFLDEPTTGLDYATERAIITQLRSLSRQGRTVVFVTHSLATIDAADHVVVLMPGREGATVLIEGSPTAVKTHLRADDWGEVVDRAAGVQDEHCHAASLPTRAAGLFALRARLPRTFVLMLRYLRVWLSNATASTALLFGLPLLLGILIRLAVSADGWIGTDRLLFGVIAAFWLGMNQSVREIVREKAILVQEQSHRVSCFSYLASKVMFFVGTAIPQAVLLSAPLKWLSVTDRGISLSTDELRCPWFLIVAVFWIGGCLGSVLGLLFSSLCLFVRQKGEVVAVLLVILITLPQFLFSAKVLPGGLTREDPHSYTFTRWHTEAPVPEFLSFFTISRYLFVPLDAVSRDMPAASKAMKFNGTILAMISMVTLTLTWLVLELYIAWRRRL